MQFAAQAFGPLAHAEQPEVPAQGCKHTVLLEAVSVILDVQTELPRFHVELHLDLARLRVPDSRAAARSWPSSTDDRRSITDRRASVRLCRAMRRARSRNFRAGVV